jgi:hypothetical protein
MSCGIGGWGWVDSDEAAHNAACRAAESDDAPVYLVVRVRAWRRRWHALNFRPPPHESYSGRSSLPTHRAPFQNAE